MHDEGKMDCNEIAKEAALANPKMAFVWNSVVSRFEGDEHLKTVVLKNVKTDEEIPVDCDNCFEFIGYLPNTELFEGQVTMTNRKYIPVNEKKETNLEGVFAIGDVTDKWLKQIATAVGDGAIAGTAVERYIAEKEIFENRILQKEKPGLIYVYNAIDAPSRDFLSRIEAIETSKAGAIAVNRIDVYKSNGIALKLNVDQVPAVVITKDGVITEKLYDLDEQKILSFL
jgi:thioredoxin reductase (NADPH)